MERWDLFCRVVDNFGDAGVCWRLARQLAHEHGAQVRVWIDDLQVLARLEPRIASAATQCVDAIEVCRWQSDFASTESADIVIEAFGCGLPEPYLDGMAARSRPPVWIVLEYLSAEAWVPSHHALASPHPRRGLPRYFFFPGFVRGTGGLPLERDLFRRRDAFDAADRDAFWRSIGHAPVPVSATVISVFAYANAQVESLLHAWETGPRRTIAVICGLELETAVLKHFSAERVQSDRTLERGQLEVRFVPFVPQPRYDELLWSCDFNFVRGEDSFVRAQWAASPFVWQAYPQQDGAHRAKVASFVELYGASLEPAARGPLIAFTRWWNEIEACRVSVDIAWRAILEERGTLARHTRVWADRVASLGTLAANLASFCRDKLK